MKIDSILPDQMWAEQGEGGAASPKCSARCPLASAYYSAQTAAPQGCVHEFSGTVAYMYLTDKYASVWRVPCGVGKRPYCTSAAWV